MKKKCLLIGVNAKYVHTNLAVRYLKSYCRKNQYHNVELKEFSINDNFDNILKEAYCKQTDIYALSCYIWNIDMVIKLSSSLKQLNPKAVIVLGGPEVSFDAQELLLNHEYVDYIIRGEGEETLLDLLHFLNGELQDCSSVLGLTYRENEQILSNPDRPLLQNLDIIPFPYEDFNQLNNKIIYYETSRGCPFSCQYCLSSTLHGVRYFGMERIRAEIKFFIDHGVKQVKLVDRTFNCNKKHSLQIIEYIMELNSKTNFHFEIGADLLDDEMLAVLAKAPKDMFQFEIGVQSTNKRALREISRAMDIDKVKHNVLALQHPGNSHLHLDLIAGLPYEDFKSFGDSFDEVHKLMPDMLQLGFLKLLKGSGIRNRAEEYGIVYNRFSPYEVLKTNWISYEELIVLKEVEHILELYYNSGRFKFSLNHLFNNYYTSSFQFYLDFADYWRSHALFAAAQSTKELYNILYRFTENKKLLDLTLNELIKLDWLLYYNNGNMPISINRFDHTKVKNALQSYLRDNPALVSSLFPDQVLDSKTLMKNIYYEVFAINVLGGLSEQQEHVVFFAKGINGNVRTISKKLSDII
ncbi:MAG: coproporphyrinogen oxidase [Clostridia bacterium]|nr:coproporphyrinogen oxidase [Clostridia bacterium]